ncbi:MAG: (d)CMP kinase [Saprospiraceae bacterium]
MSIKSHRPLVIAIDGFSSCGKSTLAKQIAKALNYVFIDSGAMYRAVTLYFIIHKIDCHNDAEVQSALSAIHISFENIDGENITLLNGENVEHRIRSLEVSSNVSEVAAISAVRVKLVQLQREMSFNKGVVMDGRDIGTVVFPNADVKIFVVADPIVRAQRRYAQLIAKNQKTDLHDIISNLAHRDKVDTERDDSPLKQAADAILLDNTHLTREEQFDWVMDMISKKMGIT